MAGLGLCACPCCVLAGLVRFSRREVWTNGRNWAWMEDMHEVRFLLTASRGKAGGAAMKAFLIPLTESGARSEVPTKSRGSRWM